MVTRIQILRSLSIEFLKELHEELPFGKASVTASGAQSTAALRQIEFKWKRTGYPEIVSRPTVQTTGQQTGIKVEATEVSFFPAIWFTPNGGDQPEENAKRFAELEKRGHAEKIKAAIFKEFPFIKDLSILYQAGVPNVFAEFEREGRSGKMPVALGIGWYKSAAWNMPRNRILCWRHGAHRPN